MGTGDTPMTRPPLGCTLTTAATLLLASSILLLTRRAPTDRADFAFNNGAEVSTLDPAAISSIPEGRIVRALFEGLCVEHPETLEPLPGMAESWTVSEDGLRYAFTIREGARWTNGDPVGASDFVYSWRRVLHPATGAGYAYLLWSVRGGRQYTALPDELLYTAEGDSEWWLEDLGGGTVRLGLTGFELEARGSAATVSLAPEVTPGASLAEGAALGRIGDRELVAPFPLAVRARHDALAETVAELLEDPYGAGWLLEARVEPGLLEGRLATRALLRGPDFRRDVAGPLHLGLCTDGGRRFEVELEVPTPYFLDLASFYPLYPVNRRNLEEARERWPADWRVRWLTPENLVTNGPYRIASRRINDRIRLVRNPTYWDAANVAFETIDAFAIEHLGTSLNLYLTGELDWIDRPVTDLIPHLRGREDFHVSPFLATYFYRVNTTEPPFDDARVRRALALAIDREAIVTKLTKAGERPAWSFTTEGLRGYPRVELAHSRDLAADLEEARRLLDEAGFGAGGCAFPTFEILYNTDQVHRDIAEVIADGWQRELGLSVKLLNQEWKVYLDSQRALDYDVVRSSWIGDYPDPNTFLDVFVTGGENNRTGWGDARYDALVEAARHELDSRRRLELLAEAEAILLEELPILPIYHYVSRNLVDPRLGGFFENMRDEHFCKFWRWLDDEELRARRAALPAGTTLVERPVPERTGRGGR